jgi:hypothetical protein
VLAYKDPALDITLPLKKPNRVMGENYQQLNSWG